MKTKHTHKKKPQNVSNIVALSVHDSDSSQFRGYCNVLSANTELQVLLSFGSIAPTNKN